MNSALAYTLIVFGCVLLLVLVLCLSILGAVGHELVASTKVKETVDEAVQKYEAAPKLDMTVTLTTVPNRLISGAIKQTLLSLLVQDPAPSEIVINIPWIMKRKNRIYEIPDYLANTGIRVRRCKDYGPATKYIPTLQELKAKGDDDRIVLVMDDDVILPHRDSIKTIYEYAQQYPDKVVTGQANYLVDKGTKTPKFNPITQFIEPKQTIFGFLTQRTSKYVGRKEAYKKADLILGYQGYVIRPHMVDLRELMDYDSMPPDAFFVDDVVMSANLAKRHVDRIVVREWPKFRMGADMTFFYLKNLYRSSRKDEGLTTTANLDGVHDKVMVEHFADVW